MSQMFSGYFANKLSSPFSCKANGIKFHEIQNTVIFTEVKCKYKE